MTNLPFILGQIGLFLAAACGIGIIHNRAYAENRPSWYYFVAVWVISVASMLLFSQQFVVRTHDFVPPLAYYFRLSFGIERLLVWYNYKYDLQSRKLSTAWILRINGVVSVISATVVVGVFGFVIYTGILENKSGLQRLQTEIKQTKAVVNDTGRIAQLENQIQSLTGQLAESRQTNQIVTAKLAKANSQLSDLIDVVNSLKKSIARLGQSVERTRLSVVLPAPPLHTKPQNTNEQIPTSKVKNVPTLDKRGRKLTFADTLSMEQWAWLVEVP